MTDPVDELVDFINRSKALADKFDGQGLPVHAEHVRKGLERLYAALDAEEAPGVLVDLRSRAS